MILFLLLAATTESSGSSSGSTLMVAAITGVATLAGSWLLFRGQSKQSDAESVIAERKLLSEEWAKIREAVDQALEDCRLERDELKHEIDRLGVLVENQSKTIAQQSKTIRHLETEVRTIRRLGDTQGDEIRHMRDQNGLQEEVRGLREKNELRLETEVQDLKDRE